ncbi:MAG: hypothetical protein ACM3MD_01030 [Betaproteobacteria bacterium]
MDDLKKAYRMTAFIGLAMMASLLIYTVLVELIKKQYEPFGGFSPMPDVVPTLRYALFAVAVVEFFIIRIVNKLNLSGTLPVSSKPQIGRSTQYLPPVQRLISGAVVTFALCESVAVYGLVLFLMQGITTDFYSFLLISLFYFSIFFPKYSAWEERIKGRDKTGVRGK